MTLRILSAILVILNTMALSAQQPGPPRRDPNRNQKSPLSMTLRGIAAHDLNMTPDQIAQLVTQGLTDGDPDVREAALFAIGGQSDVLMHQTAENLASWQANRSTLIKFKPQVEQLLVNDQDERVRAAALLAFNGLSLRPGEGQWTSELDAKDVEVLARAFPKEPMAGIRGKTVMLLAFCGKCPDNTLSLRQQAMRDAIYDADAGVVQQAIRGAGELKIADMLPRVVQLLSDESDGTRLDAATALHLYGREAARYAGEIQAALAKEKREEIRGILTGSLQAIQ